MCYFPNDTISSDHTPIRLPHCILACANTCTPSPPPTSPSRRPSHWPLFSLYPTTHPFITRKQGAVILRLIPLHFCPLPPKPGREHMHDLDGVAMDHHPLSRKEREEVMEETLRLLRGQGEMKGLNEDGSGHGEQGGR